MIGQPPGETVTTPLASVQEEKEETEWPQGDDKTTQQENGNDILRTVIKLNVMVIVLTMFVFSRCAGRK